MSANERAATHDQPASAPAGGSGHPTPVFEFTIGADSVSSRFGREVAVDERMRERLRSACPSIDTGAAARVEAGRDWWPLAVRWGLAATVPALPQVVARPADSAEAAAVLAVCQEAGVPVTPAAGRSGVCGGSVPVFGGVALDLTALSGIVAVDDRSLAVTVRAGTFGDRFEQTLRADHGLTLGHWPQSIALSTVGGWLACRSAGQYSTRYGKIEDLVVGLEVALADGRVIHTGGAAPRAATGPDLSQLFVGSEGTLGVITEATLRARPLPASEARSAYGFASFDVGLDACRRILRRGATPAVLRLYDTTESDRAYSAGGRSVLIVLDEGDAGLTAATMAVVADECAQADRLDEALVERWLQHRNEVPSLEGLARAGIVADTIEVAGSWTALPAIYETALTRLRAMDGTLAASAHQSHAYLDGACLYFTFAGRPADDPGAGDAYYRRAWDTVIDVTVAHGGAISHHHGIGLNRGRYLRHALGPAFDVLAELKVALDPSGVLNPGKLGLPSPFGEDPWP